MAGINPLEFWIKNCPIHRKTCWFLKIFILIIFICLLSNGSCLASLVSETFTHSPVVLPSPSVDNSRKSKLQEKDCFVGTFCEYKIPEREFNCKVEDVVVSLEGQRSLPKWLWFNKTKRTLVGIPFEENDEPSKILIVVLGNIPNNQERYICGSLALKITVWELKHSPLFTVNSMLVVKLLRDTSSITCGLNNPVIFASLMLAGNFRDLNKKERQVFLETCASLFRINIENTFVTGNVTQNPFSVLLGSSHVVASGSGVNSTAGTERSILLTWYVKCGVISMDDLLFENLKQLSQKRFVLNGMTFSVIGWYVTTGYQRRYIQDGLIRNRRNVVGKTTPVDTSTISVSQKSVVTTRLTLKQTFSSTVLLTRPQLSPTFSPTFGDTSSYEMSVSSSISLEKITLSSLSYSTSSLLFSRREPPTVSKSFFTALLTIQPTLTSAVPLQTTATPTAISNSTSNIQYNTINVSDKVSRSTVSTVALSLSSTGVLFQSKTIISSYSGFRPSKSESEMILPSPVSQKPTILESTILKNPTSGSVHSNSTEKSTSSRTFTPLSIPYFYTTSSSFSAFVTQNTKTFVIAVTSLVSVTTKSHLVSSNLMGSSKDTTDTTVVTIGTPSKSPTSTETNRKTKSKITSVVLSPSRSIYPTSITNLQAHVSTTTSPKLASFSSIPPLINTISSPIDPGFKSSIYTTALSSVTQIFPTIGPHSTLQPHSTTEIHSTVGADSTIKLQLPTWSYSTTGPHLTTVVYSTTEAHSTFGLHSTIETRSTFGLHSTIGPHSSFGSHSTIGPHSTIESHSVIGPHSTIKPHSTIGSHPAIGPHSTFGTHSTIKPHSTIGSHSAIGPHSTIRTQSTFVPQSAIGPSLTIRPPITSGLPLSIKPSLNTGPFLTTDQRATFEAYSTIATPLDAESYSNARQPFTTGQPSKLLPLSASEHSFRSLETVAQRLTTATGQQPLTTTQVMSSAVQGQTTMKEGTRTVLRSLKASYFTSVLPSLTNYLTTTLLTTPTEKLTSSLLVLPSISLINPSTSIQTNSGLSSSHSTYSLVTSPSSVLSSSTTISLPTTSPNSFPKVYNSFDLLIVRVGEVFSVQVPIDTFHDREDGNTRNLFLICYDSNSKPLPKDSWLQFNSTTQTLYGVILKSQVEQIRNSNEYLLVARDRAGNEARDAFTIQVQEETKTLAVEYTIKILGIDLKKFNEDINNILSLVNKIARYYGDADALFVQVISRKAGSVLFTWSNTTIESCNETLINELSVRITTAEGKIQPSFSEVLLPKFIVEDVYKNKTGPCVAVVTDVPPVQRLSSHDGKLWLKYFIPGLVIAIIVIIIAISCFVVRRHSGVKVLKADKQTFKRRKPVILDDEREMCSFSGKPVELPDDSLSQTQFPKQSSLGNDGFDDVNVPPWLSPIQAAPPYHKLPPKYERPGDGYRTPPPPYKLPPSY